MTVRSMTCQAGILALAATLTLGLVPPAAHAADTSVKVLAPRTPTPELQLKGNATAEDVHCSTVPSQTLQPCTGDFKAWCKVVGGTYGGTGSPGVDACFHRNEW